tara:strand:+ start:1346 stop:1744 length:399 start_codon:yes stop_codon:yes gene_type:complete
MSVNKVMLLGRLGQDPELRNTASGTEVCNFSLATSKTHTDKNGEKKETTEWHKVVVWGKLASVCGKYLAKGRSAFVEGEIQTKSYEDKEGQKKFQTQINALSVKFIGGNDKLVAQKSKQSTKDNFSVDDLPF